MSEGRTCQGSHGPETAECRVERLAAGGDGVARLADGRVVFVDGGAPGDRVEIEIHQSRRRYARGRIRRVLEAGPGRTDPACEVFGRCGGCRWQHLDHATQCEAKVEILREALRRIGGFVWPGEIPFVASPRAYGYRMRARLVEHEGALGYRARASHRMVPVSRCPVLEPELEEALARGIPDRDGSGARSDGPRSRKAAGTDGTSEWELVRGDAGDLRWARLTGRPGGRADPSGPAIVLPVPTPGGGPPRRLRLSPGVFCQANRSLHGALVDAVAAALAEREPGPRGLLVELHAGAGFFTVALGGAYDAVLAVESDPAAVRDLRANLATAGLEGARILQRRCEDWLEDPGDLRPDAVLLDPPRSGLGPGPSEALAALGARRIVYVSCDPATLARDLSVLGDHGYVPASVTGLDLFPQTPHVEAVVALDRAEGGGLRAR